MVQRPVGCVHEVYAVPSGEPGGQGASCLAGADAQLGGEFLGGGVGLVQVVLPPVEELADLLVRGERRGRVAAAAVPALRHLRQPLGQRLVALPEAEQHRRHGGLPGGQFGQVGGGDPAGGQLVGERLAQVGQHPAGVARGEEAGVHPEGLGQPQQYGHGQRP